MAMTTYMEERALNALRGISFQGFQNIYVGLFTSNTGDDGSGVEVRGGSYQRVRATFSEPIKTGVSSQISNDTELDFGIATADWGVVTNVAIFDSKEGGNMLYHEALRNGKSIEMGDSLRFGVNQLIISKE